MFRVIKLQLIGVAAIGLLLAVTTGHPALLSYTIGAFACLVPNALFALRISAAIARPDGAGPATFVMGELIKIGATLAILLAAVKYVDTMVWWALILGMVVALKSYVLSFFWAK